MQYPDHFQVIVIGGGHAGTEEALAAARTGAKTLLITHNIETLGQMSCNPSIGGIGKSHLVREIDALGGAMALATDESGIQFRVLNSRKGPAVRATRAQADRVLYKSSIRRRLERQSNLTLFQQAVDDLVVENGQIAGVVTSMGLTFTGDAVVLTAGTFLGGKIHIGLNNYAGGRAGDDQQLRGRQRCSGSARAAARPQVVALVAEDGRRQRRQVADHVGRLLAHHDGRRIGIAAHDGGHNGGVCHTQAFDAVYAELCVHYGHVVMPHFAGAHRVINGFHLFLNMQ